MEMDQIQADLNEDRKINIKSKFTNAFRKIATALKEKRDTMHIPSVKFVVVKALKKVISALEEAPTIEKSSTVEPSIKTAPIIEPEPALTNIQNEEPSIKTETTIEPESALPNSQSEEPEQAAETTEQDDKEKGKIDEPTEHKTIFGNIINSFIKNKDEQEKAENNDKETENTSKKVISGKRVSKDDIMDKAKPAKTAIPINLHIIPAKRNDIKEANQIDEPKKSDPETLKDLNEKYGDLISFNTWEDYYNSFSDEERENKTKTGELLTEERFISVRLEEAQTIKRITQAEEAERQIEKDKLNSEIESRRERVKENRETIRNEKDDIARLEAENVDLNKQNQRAGSSLRTLNNESDKANAKIDEMDEIIVQLAPKKADSNFDSKKRVDEILKEEEAEFAKKRKANSEQKASKHVEKPSTTVEPKEETTTVEPQVEESSLVDEISDFDDTKINNGNIILESTNPDYPGTLTASNDEVTANWKTSPIIEETNSFIPQDSQPKEQNDLNNNQFDLSSYLNSLNTQPMTETQEQVKGRTR